MYMRRTLILFGLALVTAGCVPGSSSIVGSGNIVTQEYEFTDFSRLRLSHSFTVDVTRTDDFKLSVSIDDNLVEYLDIKLESATLKIGMDSAHHYSVGNDSMRATVHVPELTGIRQSGATSCKVSGFQSEKDLEIDLSGASSLKGDMVAGSTRLDLSGASSVTLRGSAEKVTIDASGASSAKLQDFSVVKAVVDLSGASNATVDATEKIDVSASGASHLTYLGNPTFDRKKTSGASSISQD